MRFLTEQPIFHAEQCHTGGHPCQHNHRTISGAQRCLPRAPRDYFSLARVIAANDAAQRLLDTHDDAPVA